jgi:hypothetical protein
LTGATGGNFTPGPQIDDLSSVKLALSLGVELGTILLAIRSCHHPQSCPSNPAAVSWRSEPLLKKIAAIHFKQPSA